MWGYVWILASVLTLSLSLACFCIVHSTHTFSSSCVCYCCCCCCSCDDVFLLFICRLFPAQALTLLFCTHICIIVTRIWLLDGANAKHKKHFSSFGWAHVFISVCAFACPPVCVCVAGKLICRPKSATAWAVETLATNAIQKQKSYAMP